MKQRYDIVIADISLTVETEAEAAEVDQIVSLLDRRMRELTQRGRGCSKVEAAVLCAMDFCGERTQLIANNRTLEQELEDSNRAIGTLKAKITEQKEEIDRLKNDNEVMHSILERAAATNKFTSGASETASTAADTEPQAQESAGADKKGKNKNRTGDMFGLLTFGDV
ncbi:MAG: cell division protein ZapA [Clostridia bacterium]|nr:cell division protein ZapA [Clostridia bacterium]